MIMLYEGRQTIDLGGLWEYRKEESQETIEEWKSIQIPNNWYLTEIGDYFGTIWFRTYFDSPNCQCGEHIWLRFGAVDYIADVWLK